MKKILSILLTTVIFFSIPTFSAFASDNNEPIAYDIIMSDEEFEKLEHVDSEEEPITSKSNSLILHKSASLGIENGKLVCRCTTVGVSGVVKSGFKYIKVQQYKNGNWVDYKTFENIYRDSNECKVTKLITATAGYKYRVTSKHYAKKSLFNTETVISTSATITL